MVSVAGVAGFEPTNDGVRDRWSDYNDKKGIFTDVLHYGCQSGIVGELI